MYILHVRARGQVGEVSSLFQPCGFWYQTWLVRLGGKPSHLTFSPVLLASSQRILGVCEACLEFVRATFLFSTSDPYKVGLSFVFFKEYNKSRLNEGNMIIPLVLLSKL